MTRTIERKRGSKGLILFGGLGLGALAMYLADPRMGRTRRAHIRQQYESAARKVQRSSDLVVHDASERATGVTASLRHWLRHRGEPVTDAVLEERVRAAIGRATTHAKAIEVHADQGRVTLTGEALQAEGRAIISRVKRVRGLRSLDDRIIAYESPEGVSSLQGGADREGPRVEPPQERWSPAWRSLAGAIGAGLTLAGWIRGGARGLAMGAVGGGLVARAATNRDLRSLVGGARRQGVVMRRTVRVDRPVDEVFREWRIERFPDWMPHVREVRPLGEGRHRWVVEGPADVPVEWDSQMRVSENAREMEWHSLPGSEVDNAGSVRLRPEGSGTRVEVTLCYIPLAGTIGQAVARALGRDPASTMDDGLARFKSVVEKRSAGAAHA